MIKIQQVGKPDFSGYGQVGWVPEEVWNKIESMQNHNYKTFSSADAIYQFNVNLNDTVDGFHFRRCMVIRGVKLFIRCVGPNEILKELI